MRKYTRPFIIGFVWDAILTVDTIVTAEKWPIYAAFTSFIITVLGALSFTTVMHDGKLSVKAMISLAIGSAAGAGIATALLKIFN